MIVHSFTETSQLCSRIKNQIVLKSRWHGFDEQNQDEDYVLFAAIGMRYLWTKMYILCIILCMFANT